MTPTKRPDVVHLALPKGRIQSGVFGLLAEAGIRVTSGARGYRPSLSLPGFETKLLKPQNIVEMLAAGTRDVGLAGADWVVEKGLELVELLDTGLDPVRLIAAAPAERLDDENFLRGPLVVASEYENLARGWMKAREIDGSFVRTYGATEVFPPEDADVIIDNTATGATLLANGLQILDEILLSSTRLYANPRALQNPVKRIAIENLTLCLQSVIEARSRAMIDLNVPRADLESIVGSLPAMRQPTVSNLHDSSGFAVRAAVARDLLPSLIPQLKARGATDIVVSRCEQIVP
jgi:ATP phosphoribosyltransferase